MHNDNYKRKRVVMPAEFSLQTVGQLIHEQRQVRKLSQHELATKAGIEQARLSRLETGRYLPTPAELGRLADVLGTSVELYYAAAGFPLPYSGMYPDPEDFFLKLYGMKPTRDNLSQIDDRVCESYHKWLEELATYSQESIDDEVAHVLSNVSTPWPLSRGELVCYEWFQLLRGYGLCGLIRGKSEKEQTAA
jgi:transcriptional regulator with XRE-family HTH domain